MFCAVITDAQQSSGRDDLLRMNENYSKAKSYSMTISVKVYESKVTSAEPTLYGGKVKKSADGYFASMKGITIIVNTNCSMMIDDNQKQIVYGSSNGKNKKQEAQGKNLTYLPDSSLYGKNQIELQTSANGRKTYLVKTPGSSYFEKMLITINVLSNTLDEIVYYYKANEEISGSKVVVTYTDVKINSDIPPSAFSEKRYITKHGEQLNGIGKYSGYKLVDSTKKISTKGN